MLVGFLASEASMETTLCDANLYPRGVLTVQFQTKVDPSTYDRVNNLSESSGPPGEGVQSRHLNPSTAQPSGDRLSSRHLEDVARRELRLKATLDRYDQDSGRGINGAVETGVPNLAPALIASTISVPRIREERSLEVDGERVRHRELALQAAAKRMTEAAQMFWEGLIPEAGEAGGGFCAPSDLHGAPATTSNDETRFASEDQDSRGKQVAACGPSSRAGQLAAAAAAEVPGPVAFAGFRGQGSRARVPQPTSSPSRPEKMQRTDEGSSTSSVGANLNPALFARYAFGLSQVSQCLDVAHVDLFVNPFLFSFVFYCVCLCACVFFCG